MTICNTENKNQMIDEPDEISLVTDRISHIDKDLTNVPRIIKEEINDRVKNFEKNISNAQIEEIAENIDKKLLIKVKTKSLLKERADLESLKSKIEAIKKK